MKALKQASVVLTVIALLFLIVGVVRAEEDTIGPVRMGPMLTTQFIRMRFNPMQTSFMSGALGGGFFAEYQTKKPTAFKPRGEIFVLASSRAESKEVDIEIGIGGSIFSIGELQLGALWVIYNPDENEFSLGIGGSLALWRKDL